MARPRESSSAVAAANQAKGFRVSGFAVFVMALLILGVVVIAPSLREYIAQRQQIADAQATVSQLKAQVSKENAERARWSDPAYIRTEARARLFYVMPGDTSYVVINDLPASATADKGPISSTIQKTRSDWSVSLFGSFMTAGLSTATPGELSRDGDTGSAPSPSPTSTPAG